MTFLTLEYDSYKRYSNYKQEVKPMLKVNKMTILRTILLVVALVNQILTITGHTPLPFNDQEINDGVAYIFTVVTAIWAWWKNNSFTQPALVADEHLKTLRALESDRAKEKASTDTTNTNEN